MEGKFAVLRERVPEAGIVVVAGCGDKREKIRTVEAGADAYITKPIDFPVFLARLHALRGRIETARQARRDIVRVANLELDLNSQTLRRLGVQIHLSPTEFSLLAYLMQNSACPWTTGSYCALSGGLPMTASLITLFGPLSTGCGEKSKIT